jgi:hypothetical protein
VHDCVERGWDDWHRGWPDRTNYSNESEMVRPHQCSMDRLPTFSVTVFFLLADRLDKAEVSFIWGRTAYICPLDVKCLVSLSNGLVVYSFPTTPRRPKATGGSNRAREFTGPLDTNTTKAPRAGLRTVRVMLNAGPLLRPFPSSLPRTSPTRSSVRPGRAADACPSPRVPFTVLTSHVTRSSPSTRRRHAR